MAWAAPCLALLACLQLAVLCLVLWALLPATHPLVPVELCLCQLVHLLRVLAATWPCLWVRELWVLVVL